MTVLMSTSDAPRSRPTPPPLPGPQTMEQQARGPARPACAYARARLLLLKPDAAVAALVTEILVEEDYAVDHRAQPDAVDAARGAGGRAACDLILSAPYADPLRAPYAWLDALRARTRAPIAIGARYPAVFYADYRARGYAAYLEEPFALETLLALVAALCPPAPAPARATGGPGERGHRRRRPLDDRCPR